MQKSYDKVQQAAKAGGFMMKSFDKLNPTNRPLTASASKGK